MRRDTTHPKPPTIPMVILVDGLAFKDYKAHFCKQRRVFTLKDGTKFKLSIKTLDGGEHPYMLCRELQPHLVVSLTVNMQTVNDTHPGTTTCLRKVLFSPFCHPLRKNWQPRMVISTSAHWHVSWDDEAVIHPSLTLDWLSLRFETAHKEHIKHWLGWK